MTTRKRKTAAIASELEKKHEKSEEQEQKSVQKSEFDFAGKEEFSKTESERLVPYKVKLRRKKEEPEDEVPPESTVPVSAGPMGKAIELAFNPSREKLPEVTVIDKFQGRLFPLVSLVNVLWDDCFHVALYRQNKDEYRRIHKQARPQAKDWLGELLFSTAQWQKSIGGINLTKITDIALAEKEAESGEERDGVGGGVDAWD